MKGPLNEKPAIIKGPLNIDTYYDRWIDWQRDGKKDRQSKYTSRLSFGVVPTHEITSNMFPNHIVIILKRSVCLLFSKGFKGR